MPPLTNADKLAKLLEQKMLLESRISELNAKQTAENRKRETRRKIVLGALMLREAEKDVKTAAWLQNFLDKQLISARDRRLFDLQPLPVPANENNDTTINTDAPTAGKEADAT